MFSEDVNIGFNADVSSFTTSLQSAIATMGQMARSSDSAIGSLNKLNSLSLNLAKATNSITGANKVAVAQAAAYQEKLSAVNATAKVAGKQFDDLSKTTMKFARDFPIGMDKAIETTRTLATSGINTTAAIGKLGKEFLKLQAASGEWGTGLTTDMLSVTRSFGNSIGMVKGFGDSLTTISAKYGASATSILGFSKSIAPIASVVGIGQAAVFGLSTAFSRLGEDGVRSATAFNKVLIDMNRSISTGSPEIRDYAKAMNMTSESLTQLFKSDPTEMVLRFTEAISKQGSSALQTLDNLGLDGVNTMKSIQTLAKSGDLRQIVADSTKAFDSGATSAGAKTALGGVNDKLHDMQEVLSQTTAVAGEPFLKFVNLGASGALNFSKGIFSIVDAAKGLGPVLTIFTAIASVLKVLTFYSLAKLGASMLSGSSFGQNFTAGRQGFASGVATAPGGLAGKGIGYGLGAGSGLLYGGGGVAGVAGRAIDNAKGAAGWFANAAARYQGNLFITDSSQQRMQTEQGRMNAINKQMQGMGIGTMTLAEQKAAFGTEKTGPNAGLPVKPDMNNPAQRSVLNNQYYTNPNPNVGPGAAVRDFVDRQKVLAKEIGGSTGHVKAFGQALAGGAKFAGGAMMEMGRDIKSVSSPLVSSLKGIGSAMGPMLAIMAVGAIYAGGKKNEAALKATFEDPFASYNKFATKAGLATKNVALTSATADIAARTKTLSQSKLTGKDALVMTGDQIENATSVGYESAFKVDKKRSAKDTATQIRLMLGANASPEALDRTMQDVLSGSSLSYQQDVAKAYTNSGFLKDTPSTSLNTYSSGLSAMKNVSPNFLRTMFGNGQEKKLELQGTMKSEILTNAQNTQSKYGSGAGTKAQLAEVAKLLLATKGKSENEVKSALEVAGDILGVKLKSASSGYFTDLSDPLSTLRNLTPFTAQTMRGNDLLQAVMESKDVAKTNLGAQYAANTAAGPNKKTLSQIINPFTGPGSQEISKEQSWLEKRGIAGSQKREDFKDLSGTVFGADKAQKYIATETGKAVSIQEILNNPILMQKVKSEDKNAIRLAGRPQDLGLQMAAGSDITKKALQVTDGNANEALKNIYEALKNPNMASTGATRAALVQSFNQLSGVNAVQQTGNAAATNWATSINNARDAISDGISSNASTEDIALYNSYIDAGKQAITTALNFAKQMQDLTRQMAYQDEDAKIQVSRMTKQYDRNRLWQIKEQNKQIRRATTEFNLQEKQAAEDFAKSVYSPFDRIAAKRTSDAYSTVGNLKQQNIAMRQQLANIAKLKALGLSDEAVQTLDLLNPNNAQETARLLTDMQLDQTLVTSTNAEVKTRGRLATQFIQSDDNTQFERSRAKFNLSVKNSTADFKTALAKNNVLFNESLVLQNEDLERSQKRAWASFWATGEQASLAGKDAASQFANALAGVPAIGKSVMGDAGRQMLSGLTSAFKSSKIVLEVSAAVSGGNGPNAGSAARGTVSTNLTKTRMDNGRFQGKVGNKFLNLQTETQNDNNSNVVSQADELLGRNYSSTLAFLKAAIKGANPNAKAENISSFQNIKTAAGGAMDAELYGGQIAMWKNDKGVQQAGLRLNNNMIERLSNSGQVIITSIKDLPDTVKYYSGATKNFADGGIVTQATNALIGEAGYPEAVVPLNNRGANMLADAMTQYVSKTDVLSSRVSPYASSVSNVSSNQYDHSTQINGPITVQSNDPNEFLRQINARQRRQRLMQPVGN